MNEATEITDEPTTHDPADEWAAKAPSGGERCSGCGEEWSKDDEPSCVCWMAFEGKEDE